MTIDQMKTRLAAIDNLMDSLLKERRMIAEMSWNNQPDKEELISEATEMLESNSYRDGQCKEVSEYEVRQMARWEVEDYVHGVTE